MAMILKKASNSLIGALMRFSHICEISSNPIIGALMRFSLICEAPLNPIKNDTQIQGCSF